MMGRDVFLVDICIPFYSEHMDDYQLSVKMWSLTNDIDIYVLFVFGIYIMISLVSCDVNPYANNILKVMKYNFFILYRDYVWRSM